MKDKDGDFKKETAKQQIIDAAFRLVLLKGNYYPSSDQITSEAGVARTLVHYYFESKEKVIDLVRQYAVGLWKMRIDLLFSKKENFESRILAYIDLSLEISIQHPHLEFFLSVDEDCKTMIEQLGSEVKTKIDIFYLDIEDEIRRKTVRNSDHGNLMIKLLSIGGFWSPAYFNKKTDIDDINQEVQKNKKMAILNYIFG